MKARPHLDDHTLHRRVVARGLDADDPGIRGDRASRGGGQTVISLDAEVPEDRYRLEPVDELDPEKLFEGRWARTILDNALARLRAEFLSGGRVEQYAVPRAFEPGEQETMSYAEAAGRLGVSESTAERGQVRIQDLGFRIWRNFAWCFPQ